jgi:hypothetical protein
MKNGIIHTLRKYLLTSDQTSVRCRTSRPREGALHSSWRRAHGNHLWIVAEHGMNAGYVRNLLHHPRVRLKLREGIRARWHTGTAHVLSDDDPRKRQRWLAGQLRSSIANAAAVRLFGTDLITVRIDLDA